MNREILFKAKRKDWEELPKDQWWVEGDLLHMRYGDIVLINNFEDQLFRCDGNTVCQFTGLHDNTKWEELTKAEKESFLSGWNYKKGRKNKVEDWKGKKIWENDILKFNDEIWYSCYTSCGTEYDSWEAENYGVVGYCDYSARYDFTKYKYNENQVEADLHKNHDIEFSEFVKEHEVIGNIFDNPELLEVR